VDILDSPGGSQHGVATDMAHSFEARDHLVKSWYITYLGRSARGGEEVGLVNLLLTETNEQVLSLILGSSEFFNHAQALITSGSPDERFVGALYKILLTRSGNTAEVAGWVDKLAGLGLQGVALGFLHALEYRTDLFTGYYNALLHRSPDVGLIGWVDSNLDVATVRIDIQSSSEFYMNG
jgi:hypothetical protein